MVAERRSDLGRGLQAVLQVLPVRVVGEEREAGQLRLPDADPLVESVEELLHRGRTVETHHLRERNAREHLIIHLAPGRKQNLTFQLLD